MSVIQKMIAVLLVIGALFAGNTRSLLSLADQAQKKTTLSQPGNCGEGCGGSCT